MNPNILNTILPFPFTKFLDVIMNFLIITYKYGVEIVSLFGLQNTFLSMLVVIAIMYYMLRGGILENWWKILIIIIFALLASKI